MKKIAVVEDNPDNRLLVSVLLEDKYELTEYERGDEALAGIRRNRPDVVLLDISLPEMDGSEVLAHIRADESLRSLKVIALTAHASPADRDRFLAEGFDDYVTKPITDENILFGAIEKALR
jgi:two-component system cell cycle response regulator DivK